jgi:hypothetical protein
MAQYRGTKAFLIFGLVALFAAVATAQNCDQSFQTYESAGYRIREVFAKAPLRGLLGTFRKSLNDYLKSSQIIQQNGRLFSETTTSKVGVDLKNLINGDRKSGSRNVRVQLASYGLENCNAATMELDVVYKFYLFEPSYYFSRTFELGRTEDVAGDRPPKESENVIKTVEVESLAGYDSSRHFFGGGRVGLNLQNPIISNIDLEMSGSFNSHDVKVGLRGSTSSDTDPVRYQSWQVSYRNRTFPADKLKLAENFGSGQYYGATQAFTNNEFIIRFGGRFEGGDLGTLRAPTPVDPAVVNESNVIGAKGFIGTSFKLGQHRFKASYGLKVAGAEGGKSVDYIKQLVDTSATFDWSPITADAGFSAGSLSVYGHVPQADRFYGGNNPDNFIDSEDWVINSQPLIRSFAANKLASPDGTNSLGGTGFLAFNLTVAARVWRKPLVDTEIWEDPNRNGEFKPEIVAAEAKGFDIAEVKLTNEYLRNLPQFAVFPKAVEKIQDEIVKARKDLEEIRSGHPPTEIQSVLDELFEPDSPFKLEVAESTISRIRQDYGEGKSIANDVEALARHSTDPDLADENTILEDLNERLLKLAELLRGQSEPDLANRLADNARIVETQSKQISEVYSQIENAPEAAAARLRAQKDLVYPRKLFRYFLRESEWISVSPLLVLDAAKLRQGKSDPNIWRYGIGGGVRLRIIFVDVTGGYVWNLQRRPGEKSGELLLKFDVANLFK